MRHPTHGLSTGLGVGTVFGLSNDGDHHRQTYVMGAEAAA